ncbi:Protein of unknown function (DUF3343) [Desulfosporosinus orientis DSM 765]|uniref:Putative Se/S carrier protein-like domain-containing protein n=2 Tax=Desulfosporosinus orientis TaxID=1563 RepID=G7W688_DESOD|nr:Protein of unknown function (DUF3343) [Desulfosporosinus orientis DSM 765]
MQKEIIFTFYNTNHVIAAVEVLIKGDVPVKVMSIPSAISAGCGLCLRVMPENLTRAFEAFAGNQVAVQQVFFTEGGQYTAI